MWRIILIYSLAVPYYNSSIRAVEGRKTCLRKVMVAQAVEGGSILQIHLRVLVAGAPKSGHRVATSQKEPATQVM